ncbi:hypothetical protein OG21DRAFT_1078499 [Imleria badia]|nr:hypothetical protein OG21DRAFT_1078499 [Imleria badia]
MGSSDTPPAQRVRSKASDFSELFRSANGSRHSSRTGAGSSPSSSPAPGEKPASTKASSRRSMLPFLGRKKPAERTAVPAMPMPRKSVGANAAYPVTTVNTVRRSFGNGHTVLMITPSSYSLPVEPPLPSTVPSMDAHAPSLGSKLAAHFTPLRSPSRNGKARHSMMPPPTPPIPSPSALSPPVPEVRAPSIESQHSSLRSRSTTPRPLRGPHSSAAENGGDEEDFSDLFTLPDQLKKPQRSPKTPSATSVHIYLGDSPTKSGELTPTTPVTPLTPSGPPLHFPIPPSTILSPRSLLPDSSIPHYSSELTSLSSQGSKSPSIRPSPARADSGRTLHSDFSSQDERHGSHRRNTSVSGSDTDTSRANDSTYSGPSFRLSPVAPKKSSSMKSNHSASSATKASSGPPPSVPLPSPPFSPSSGSLGPRSAPGPSPNRVVFPRPRANTLSVTSNFVVPCQALPRSNHSSPPRSSRAISDATADATVDELREAFSQQRRKNVQLQEYIVTITKRYEDDRMAMTKNIEKLERNIRKKMREIEGLRWLVIHNGAVSDIDAAANLARSSFSTQDGDALDACGPCPVSSGPVASHPPFHQSVPGQKGASSAMAAAASTPEFRSDALSSAASFSTTSLSETGSLSTTPSLSVIPERIDGISRAERQRLKEERRASKALRRMSAASSLTLGTDALIRSSAAESPVNPNFDPKQGMDEVLEKLHPFRHA